jgi:phospholipid/cholesterol/gamma-HCH transport system permease protein
LDTAGSGRRAILEGAWTALDMGQMNERLAEALRGPEPIDVDLTQVERCDTSGAWGVLKALADSRNSGRVIAPEATERMMDLVRKAMAVKAERRPVVAGWRLLVEDIGRGVFDIAGNVYDTIVFFGQLLVTLARSIVNPRKIRWAAVFALAERAGLDAIPIIAVTTFFIGAVVGLLGAHLLAQFGAQVFVVELIGFAVLREFNILITALLLAGRSASSFAAEIGSMKMNQEVAAMQVLGVDPFEALVVPRFLSLLLTIPLLTFIATLAGLAGGLVVSLAVLGVEPAAFFQRLIDNVGITAFWIGLSKAPVMAGVIASIGCRQGLEVGGDVESLGRKVTAAVVQAIFAAIFIDAAFALIYMKLNL